MILQVGQIVRAVRRCPQGWFKIGDHLKVVSNNGAGGIYVKNITHPERTDNDKGYGYALSDEYTTKLGDDVKMTEVYVGEQTTASTVIKSETVVLTTVQAQSLQAALEYYNFNREVLVEFHCETCSAWEDRFKHLNAVKLDTLIRALYIGFDVEKTPEQEVAEYYSTLSDAEMQAIRYVLGKLNIKIPGVNLPV